MGRVTKASEKVRGVADITREEGCGRVVLSQRAGSCDCDECLTGPNWPYEALQLLCERKIGLTNIWPGEPWNNGCVESLNNRFRNLRVDLNGAVDDRRGGRVVDEGVLMICLWHLGSPSVWRVCCTR